MTPPNLKRVAVLSTRQGQFRVLAVNPFELPNATMTVAAVRAGALGVLDLGGDARIAKEHLRSTDKRLQRAFGVRITSRSALGVAEVLSLAPNVGYLLVENGLPLEGMAELGVRLIVEITSVQEAQAAEAAGAWGLVAKGSESGGRVGEETAFVLTQSVTDATELPIWVQGGVGTATAAAAIAGGAAGVVLSDQLALVRESLIPDDLRLAITAMDGSETAVFGEHRVYVRPDLPSAKLSRLTTVEDVSAAISGRSLKAGFVPVGQEASFAKVLASKYRSTGGVIQAHLKSMKEQPAKAAEQRALAPGSRLAEKLGSRYPIAQGPMTRVSDVPEFSLAVAKAGGVPFLALALLRGDEVREILSKAKDLLGDMPWGAGILGFVPPELREEQLAEIAKVLPPLALIAGGRPTLAKPLEDAGITTFLHVPSPGLLDRFIAEGARNFVFEGRECGGHVGPRSSFALWEPQIERIVASGKAEEINALFAGGVHDAKSAAMVSAMAAGLVEAGASVGVLMGTAYIFTQEAVTQGAIMPGFQSAAVGAKHTVLLETSPGHATRCVDSDYVAMFEAERDRLEAEGAPAKEMWGTLEMLNLGRLRIASKGLSRDGDRVGSVDEGTQVRDGMFMMGQVAALRADTTTVADLHSDVSEGGQEVLSARVESIADEELFVSGTRVAGSAGSAKTSRARQKRKTANDAPDAEVARPAPVASERRATPIAIIGIGCIFPEADSKDRFWGNIVKGVNSITEVPAERWTIDRYYDKDSFTSSDGKKTPSKWGGFIPAVTFDALSYGIPPKSLSSIEPCQLLGLEVAQRALADAGYADREFERDKVSVIFGAEAGTDLASTYGFKSLFPEIFGEIPEEMAEKFPTLTEDSFPGVLTNVIAGRIANRLDLGGVNYTVDAACAASLAALDLSCKELVEGVSDMVLCGAADLHNGITDYLLFSAVHALSPTGQCQSFDAEADGIVLGEGVACVVLKRLADAERDGDRIYSVIEGIAGSSDGRCLGLTAPRAEGQRRALDRAYSKSGVKPSQVGMIEAHGTGTVVGDRTELATLNDFFEGAGASPAQASLGSIKSQIGHTKCAAGLAGIIKTSLALYNGVRPPTLNISAPNPGFKEGGPFTFRTETAPWPDAERIAGVSAFGFGGTNFHAVLRAHDGSELPRHGYTDWPAELFLFRGDTVEDALVQIGKTEALIDAMLSQPSTESTDAQFRDLAFTTCTSGSGPAQYAVVASGLEDLRAKLTRTRIGEFDPKNGIFQPNNKVSGGKVAFLFPGQGSQRPGMLSEIFVAFPSLQRYLAPGVKFVPKMFPPMPTSESDKARFKEEITDTTVAQPALGMAGMAMAALLSEFGVEPAMAGGHSYGELVALWLAGAIDAEDLPALSEARGQLILAAAGSDPGGMAAVSARGEQVAAALPKGSPVVVANDNSPSQVVISGPTKDLEVAISALEENGLACRMIPVACAFHSPVVAQAAPAFAERLSEAGLGNLELPVYSNTIAAPYPEEPEGVIELLANQIANPVRFTEQIERMYEDGARIFVETGPGKVLTQLVAKILGDRPHLAVCTDVSTEHGIRRLLVALAELATSGVEIDPARLFEGRARKVEAGSLVAPKRWMVNGHLVRDSSGNVVAGGLLPAPELRVELASVAAAQANGPTSDAKREAITVQARAVQPSQAQVPEQAAPPPGAIAGQQPSSGLPGVASPSSPPARRNAPAARQSLTPNPAAQTRPPIGDRPANAQPAQRQPQQIHHQGGVPVYPSASGRDAAMLAHLQAMREIVEAQRQVMLGYLGTAQQSPEAQQPVFMPGQFAAQDERWAAPAPAAAISAPPDSFSRSGAYDQAAPQADFDYEQYEQAPPHSQVQAPPAQRQDLGSSQPSYGGGSAQSNGSSASHSANGSANGSSGAPSANGYEPHSQAPVAHVRPDSGGGAVPMLSGEALLVELQKLVSERTGYPIEMLGADLDLEADLSIDSIKRLEIIGDLAEKAGFGTEDAAGGLDESVVEELVAQTTLREIVGWIDAHFGFAEAVAVSDGGNAQANLKAEPGSVGDGTRNSEFDAPSGTPPWVPEWSIASVLRPFAVPVAAGQPGDSLSGLTVTIVEDDGPMAQKVAELLVGKGASVSTISKGDPIGNPDVVLHLGVLWPRSTWDPIEIFTQLKPVLANGTRGLMLVTGLGGLFGRESTVPREGSVPLALATYPAGGGISGMAKSIAAEYPHIAVRALDLDPGDESSTLAEYIALEMEGIWEESKIAGGDQIQEGRSPVAVGYHGGTRTAIFPVETNAEYPPRDAHSPIPPVDENSVILLTGGAKGITGKLAVALAAKYRCQLELAGRSPLPDPEEDPVFEGCADAVAIRKALIEKGLRKPAEIEAECSRILGAREIRNVIAAIQESGGRVNYHQLDVRDRDAVHAMVASIYAHHGRIDGLVHGAGVIEDKLIADKTPESFERVYSTKTESAKALAESLRDDIGFMVFFTSISGAFGNRGQVDYACANDSVATFAWELASHIPGRVIAIDWGPWAETGMVSPELEREYVKRGIGLVGVGEGIGLVLYGLESGRWLDTEVVFARTRIGIMPPQSLQSASHG